MDKKNEKTAQTNEMMELTLDQMDKVSGGVNDEFIVFRCGNCGCEFIPEGVTLCCPNCGAVVII